MKKLITVLLLSTVMALCIIAMFALCVSGGILTMYICSRFIIDEKFQIFFGVMGYVVTVMLLITGFIIIRKKEK